MWLALFNGASQIFSWFSTLIVARLLMPDDYGLMEMATLLTGYVLIFHEMGLGSAIIQRDEISEEGLSSVFWLSVVWGVGLAMLCWFLAYPTVAIFDKPELLNITRAVSILFLLGPIIIVPRNLMHRELRFKEIGFIMAVSICLSCISMIALAWMGAGVWTLLAGHIVRESVQVVLLFSISRWRPLMYFSLSEAMPYLKFGLPVVGARSVNYLISKTDIFFGGRGFSTNALGQYSFALRLAEIPNFKILSIFNSVAYPALSKLKHDKQGFEKLYLQMLKIVAMIVLPVYLGGSYVAAQLIPLVLGEQWVSAVVPFQYICMGQLAMSLSFANGTINMAQGRPRLDLYFRLGLLPFVIAAFYWGAKSGSIEMLALPWATVIPLAHIVFTIVTLRYLELPIATFLRNLASPVLGSALMLLALAACDTFVAGMAPEISDLLHLLLRLAMAVAMYVAYILLLERDLVSYALTQYRQSRG